MPSDFPTSITLASSSCDRSQTTELASAILAPADPFLRHRWVELKGQPADPDRVLAVEGGDGLLQPPLTDEAPRADHVGDYVNVQDHDNHRTGERDRLS